MTKDIIGWDIKVASLLGSLAVVVFPLFILAPDVLAGNKYALCVVISFIGMVDLSSTLNIKRLEKRISDLENK